MCRFQPVQARCIEVDITAAGANPLISRFEVYG